MRERRDFNLSHTEERLLGVDLLDGDERLGVYAVAPHEEGPEADGIRDGVATFCGARRIRVEEGGAQPHLICAEEVVSRVACQTAHVRDGAAGWYDGMASKEGTWCERDVRNGTRATPSTAAVGDAGGMRGHCACLSARPYMMT